MSIPNKVLNILRQGRFVSAELPAPRSDYRAFVMIIPQVPDPSEHPDAWIHWGHHPYGDVIRIKDPSFITGYEIRHLEHHAKYTEEEWGMDYDYVLDDTTTRIKRIYLKGEDEIESALERWLKDVSELQDEDDFNSSLVGTDIDAYLNRPNERPHLWL